MNTFSIARAMVSFAIAAVLCALPLSAQLEDKSTTGAVHWSIAPKSHGQTRIVPGDGIEFRPTTRDPFFVTGNIQVLGYDRCELKKIVVHFRLPSPYSALTSIEVTDPRFGRMLYADTAAHGDRTRTEFYTPRTSANAWQLPTRVPPATVDSKTVVRLGVSLGMPIDSGGAGDPFVLYGVDIYCAKKGFVPTSPQTKTSLEQPRVTPPNPAPPAPIANLPDSKAVIYAISPANELLWYRHDGRTDGVVKWASNNARIVGNGWNFRTVIGAGNGVVYAITPQGDLVWYRHEGRGDGTFNWVRSDGVTVNTGFRAQVIAAGGGVIYVLHRNGELLWYRHVGYADGTDRWIAKEGRLVSTNFHFLRIFAGGAGIIYGLTPGGDLYRFRHEGRETGTNQWTDPNGMKIASNWNYLNAFSSGDGIIYATMPDQRLVWFRDNGRDNNTIDWATPDGKVVGVGWNMKTIFSGAVLEP